MTALTALAPRVVPRLAPLWTRLAAVTALGWTVLAASAVALAAGTVAGWAEATLAGLTGLVAFALGAVFTIGRMQLLVTLEPRRRRLEPGRSTRVDVVVRNAAARAMLPLTLEVGTGAQAHTFRVPRLAAGGDPHVRDFPVDALRRGVIPVGPAGSVRGDPLGMWQRRVTWTGVTEIFVHPRTVRLAALGQGLLRDLEGRTTNDMSTSDLAFHTLREYVPGDDRRYIHWRSSAKTGSAGPVEQFMVRQFRDTRRTHLMVIVDGDPRSYPDPDDFETAVSVGASVAARAVEDGVDTTALVGDRWIGKDPGRRQHRGELLDMCARAATSPDAGLPGLTVRGLRVAPGTTSAVLVTGANPAPAALRKVTAQLPPGVRAVTIRVDPLAHARLLSTAALTVLTLARLEDLPMLLLKGEAA
ncbi:DUF58 domain-containing protein [Dactylosporangium vinaceum]|uniref:DUF58 domain-containing protein n=1 Tax=Dactylosporangium vinaceum TaxID=53362 RepID=A0ABV5MK04_9ACTN|nr:DUF58 domain-containing protein [Dactylosporangium vinaceum]UAB92758.1 DUF58 domain-containing protein [Dactylosporangium vinaceum]